ncbi:MAG: glycosyltransferase [Chloroflexota bacterium]
MSVADRLGHIGHGLPDTRARGRLNVLMVADSLDAGGAERHVVGLSASLVAAGHSVTLACSVGGVLTDLAERHGVTVRSLMPSRAKRRVSPGFAYRLRALLLRESFTVVHAHMYASAAAAVLATTGLTVPVVVTEHSEATWRGTRARLFSRYIYWRARHVIAVSHAIRKRLLELDGVQSERITVISNALPDFGSPLRVSASPIAMRGRPVIGVAARLQTEKGVRFFLEAAAMVASTCPEAYFAIAGEGPERSNLERLAESLGLENQCCFLGFRPDAQALMKQFAVLVVPSLSEGTPLVVLEAMAARVPVVATAVGGIPEQIADGCEGLLVPPADSAALSRAITRLLQDRAYAGRLGRNGLRRVAECFNSNTMLRATLNVYDAVVRAPLRRP